jgi:predicted homoserine dehydrogenase-like protein
MANRRLLRPVPAGAIITTEAIDLGPGSVLVNLSKAQDERFFGSSASM